MAPSMAKRVADWAIMIGFGAALCLPLLQRPKQIPRLFFGSDARNDSTQLLSFTDVDQRFIKRFPRHDLVAAYNRLRFSLFGLVPRSVILGDHNWLFYNSEMANDWHTMDDFRGERFPGAETLGAWSRLLKDRQDRLAQHGTAYLVVVAPNKQSVYPEFLPRWIQRQRAPRTLLDHLIGAIPAAADKPVLDLRETLRAAKQQGPVYYQTDTHWNDVGAEIAARAIVARLRATFPSIPVIDADLFATGQMHFSGDIAAMALLAEHFSEDAPRLVPRRALPIAYGDGRSVFDVGLGINGIEPHFSPGSTGETATIEQTAPTLPRAIIFGDSFSLGLAPLLSPYFQRLQVVKGPYDQALVSREQPQVVIQETAERYLERLFENP